MRSPGCVMTPSTTEDSDIVFSPLASPLPVAVIPTFSYLGGLTAQNHVIHSPNLIFIDSQLLTTVILLGLESPVSFHPGVHTLHSLWAASPQQFLSTCFSGCYGNRSHWVRCWGRGPPVPSEEHNACLAHPCPSVSGSPCLPKASSHLVFPVPCLQSSFFLLKKGDLLGPAQLQGSALCQVLARSDGPKVTGTPSCPPLTRSPVKHPR